MITTAFINTSYYLLSMIVGIFPASTGFPASVMESATSLGGYVGIFDPLLPISTMATALTLIIGVELSIFGYKTTKSLIAHLPQVGGKGH